jgi:hypothetical protein
MGKANGSGRERKWKEKEKERMREMGRVELWAQEGFWGFENLFHIPDLFQILFRF